MSERAEEFQIREDIGTLHQVLATLHDTKERYSDVPKLETKFRKKLGMMLWEVLPKHVIALDLGGGLEISRSDSETRYVPPTQREIWNLPRVDEYGAKLSQAISQEWEPIFQPIQTA